MTYPFASTWQPTHDVVALLLLVTVATIVVLSVIHMVRSWRASRRREQSRWDAWLDRMWAEASDLYRDDPFGGRTRRWEDRR